MTYHAWRLAEGERGIQGRHVCLHCGSQRITVRVGRGRYRFRYRRATEGAADWSPDLPLCSQLDLFVFNGPRNPAPST